MASVFISHSSADKARFVQPLVNSLRDRHHTVWYDTQSIRLTDSIPLKISEGLESSEYAVVVISPSFLTSSWCRRELAAIIMGHTSEAKKLIIVQLDGAAVPKIISDIHRVVVASDEPEETHACIMRVHRYLDEEATARSEAATTATATFNSPDKLVGMLLEEDRAGRFGSHLLPVEYKRDRARAENEGLIMIKPGGTFYEPCLRELLRRITERCRVRQVRLFNGPLVAHRSLFEQQYATATSLANGEIPLTADDLQKIREIYDSPEFMNIYGTPYSDDLVTPALTLTQLEPLELSKLWEHGRLHGLFHNRRPNGLNKIGYQKSVFPINLPGIGVRLVLNGFIPGYRHLFVEDQARVVAIHVSSAEPWQVIRDQVVGGDSDPHACARGSIRKAAAEGKLPLDPTDSVVNGQRNVCHSSATLFDGMRELCLWFEYSQADTVLGQICALGGLDLERLDKYSEEDLPDFSWFTRGDNLAQVFFEVRLRLTKEDHRGDVKFEERIADYARQIDPHQDLRDLIRQDPSLEDFIEDGLRLAVGGEELYLHTVARVFKDKEDKVNFLEVARSILAIAKERPELGGREVVAAAFRIAAGDLMFLKCPAYESVDSPQLFSASVTGELAEQALECALRTESNLVRDLRASYSSAPNKSVKQSVSIQDNPAWKEFLRQNRTATTRTPIAAIILCGGRSTRMASTIPKPILPLRDTLLVQRIDDAIRRATAGEVDVFAAVGFRKYLIRKAIGDRMRYLSYEKTLGLGFRVAACLETLSPHAGLVIVAYADMPDISSPAIGKLIESVTDTKTFGLLESQSDLSGHIIRHNGRIQRILQSRLERPPREETPRDVGLYAFYNTPEFREVLRSISNDNVRGEYMFGDVVGHLAAAGWEIVAVRERPERAHGINTPSDLLAIACGIKEQRRVGDAELRAMLRTLSYDYLLDTSEIQRFATLKAAIKEHRGPVHFFRWWDGLW